MTTDAGAVAPYSGTVVEPSAVTSADANLGHQFFNVVRHLIQHSNAYRNETDQTAHLAVVQRYENSVVGEGALRHLTSESDPAAREDVSQRIPAPGQNVTVVPPAAVAPIDYDRLAAAILAAQRATLPDDTAKD